MGPRALGNRSILGDPRDPFLRDLLNRQVKQREYYRPYAPVVMAEHVADFFEDAVPSPYMSFAARVRPSRQHDIPAVIARDGTARIQTVTREQNAELYRLLTEFHRLTGIPLLLNTSFNRREPMVLTPEDAVRTFLASDIPLLIMGRYAIAHPRTPIAEQVRLTRSERVRIGVGDA
jgi:carbamoyltransferase